jgi:hypothetical protein
MIQRHSPAPRLATHAGGFPRVESNGDADIMGPGYRKRKGRMVEVLLDPAGIS